MLFWNVFDGVLSYVAPLAITQAHFSKSMMGFIIGTSSMAGGVFDLLFCQLLRNIHYRRAFLILFAVCAFYPLVLWKATSIGLFIFAMALWGIYYDLYSFGTFDFVGNHVPESAHASSFGVIRVFQALGTILSPLLAGLVIFAVLDNRPFALSWIFLGIAFLFLLVFLWQSKNLKEERPEPWLRKKRGFKIELRLLKRIGYTLLPVLTLTVFLNIISAFVWTLGPLFAQDIKLGPFQGLFVMAYTLPSLLVGWLVGLAACHFGKKRTAFVALLLGSALFSLISFFQSDGVIIAVTFAASFFIALAWPAINGAYADYIMEAPPVAAEIESLEDLSANIGYVIGPIMAGLIADYFGNGKAFTVLGVMGMAVAVALLLETPRKITLRFAKKSLV